MSDLVERMALLPCPTPWCGGTGGEPYVFERRRDILGVCCPGCSVSTPYFPTQDAAVECWNTRAALEASGLTGGCPADDALNAELSERDKEVERLRAALHGIAVALPLGPRDSVSTWHSLADACQRTARAALPTPSRGGHDAG